MLALLVILASGELACGGGIGNGGGRQSTPGTSSGSYTITVTGVSGSVTQGTIIVLTVQ